MFRFCAILALLLLVAPLPASSTQETPPNAAVSEESAPAKPARRPPMPRTVTFESAFGDVEFPHRVHQKMGCQKCHHQIKAKDLVTPHEDYLGHSWVTCHRCHNEDTVTSTVYYGCEKCHHSNLENIADETLSAKVVLHKNCWQCHLAGTGAEASQRCADCHQRDGRPLALAEPAPGD